MEVLLVRFFQGVDFETGSGGDNELLPEIDLWGDVGAGLCSLPMNLAGGSVEYKPGSEGAVAGVKQAFHFSNPSNAAGAVWAADIVEKTRSARAGTTESLIKEPRGNYNWQSSGS